MTDVVRPIARTPVTNGLLAMLRDVVARPVGDAVVPGPLTGTDDLVPYTIVYGMPGGRYTGPPLLGSETSAQLVYQVTSVGETREQAEALADRNRDAILAMHTDAAGWLNPISAGPGRHVMSRDTVAGPGEAVAGDGPPDSVWHVDERFVLHVEPD